MDLPDVLDAQASAWGLALGTPERDLLLDYARLLASYERANVIGTRDLDSIVLHHVLDSLSCFLFKPLSRAGRMADVGSGGGLPGLPIKLAKPDLQATLVESTCKKSRFLDYVVEVLGLNGVMVANARVENLAHSAAYRGTYDVATTRAVAQLSVIAEYCVPLIRVGGYAVSMKANLPSPELSEGRRAMELVGAKMSECIRVPFIPEVGDRDRQLVIIEKLRETHPRYPRKPGTPTKTPLGAD